MSTTSFLWNRYSIQFFLIEAFVFLGPLGNIFTPYFLPYPFRFYYFLLPLFPIFYSLLFFKEIKTLLLFLPFLFYSLASSLFVQFHSPPEEAFPIFRFFLLASQFLFILGGACFLHEHEVKERLIKLYLWGFFVSLIIGYIFYIGFYLHLIPFPLIEKFSVLTQFGFGILRFSPGSYPNEYGNIASFVLSILTLFIAERKNPQLQFGFSPIFLKFFFILTFFALILTTSRAAYFSYLITLLYLLSISKPMRRSLAIFGTLLFFFLIALHFYAIHNPKTILLPLQMLFLRYATGHIRLEAWNKGLEAFQTSPILGTGFGSQFFIHNVYLQFLFELGVIGSMLLFFALILFSLEHLPKLRALFARQPPNINHIMIIGLIHFFWFAASNHNINHHQTWFIFLLLFISLFQRQFFRQTAETPA
jgi:O-antigen ligase